MVLKSAQMVRLAAKSKFAVIEMLSRVIRSPVLGVALMGGYARWSGEA